MERDQASNFVNDLLRLLVSRRSRSAASTPRRWHAPS
jgi:hypothetical protein